MTAPKPEPRVPLWLPCDRCGRAGAPSPLDPRFCASCLPRPEIVRHREEAVARRHRLARHAANRTLSAVSDAPVAPDAEHVWLQARQRGVAHLFADATQTSLCGRLWLGREVSADLETPAPENGAACRSCWTAYRSGRRTP